jgi:hypothetical protein
LRDISITLVSNVMKLIEGLDKTRSDLTLIINAKRYAKDFKTRPVVPFKHFGRKKSCRMAMKVR